MINGIYSGATGLDNFSRQQEMIAANLAHLNTPGYRRQQLSFQENLDGANATGSNPSSRVIEVTTDFQAGTRKNTGRPLDVAINGEAFFVFQGEPENVYSRAGILFRDATGTLVNRDGLAILDDGKPIKIPQEISDRDINISTDGQVSANGQLLGTLSLVQFDDPQLLESNSQVFFSIGQATEIPAEEAGVVQGFRELANSHPVTELIGLIVGSRNFESAQRAIRTLSDAIQENIRS